MMCAERHPMSTDKGDDQAQRRREKRKEERSPDDTSRHCNSKVIAPAVLQAEHSEQGRQKLDNQ